MSIPLIPQIDESNYQSIRELGDKRRYLNQLLTEAEKGGDVSTVTQYRSELQSIEQELNIKNAQLSS